ncbi:FMN-binding domain-containing protein [Curtobacterium sp. UNCCL20]|uniref:FMN-binding protein n=1 Tax=Curtobacterium sp. UNCCL20 TaxID=1502773 RepID=UPI00088A806B|nr:FMN-binding protein [Curtobacterium sp. UNCCL20]SDR03149.1 FMN-binding domain-containing protein [Curtobacterium sp. UNCCL20]
MRARVIAGGVVTSAAVLVIGWQLGGQPAVTAQSGTTSGSSVAGSSAGSAGSAGSTGSSSSSGSTSGSGSSSGSTSGSGSSSSVSGTFAGATTQTQFGPVQVQIVVADGKITDVTALQLTDRDGRSVQISQQAAPILRQEALQAQSATIQAVSGATYTSEGYTTSLQSAIDKAGL